MPSGCSSVEVYRGAAARRGLDARKNARKCDTWDVDDTRADETVSVEARTVVLVEGTSDRIALETLSRRLGRNLEGEGVSVVPMGGVQAIGRQLATLGPPQGQRVFGLYDVREENLVRRSLEQVGVTDVGIALTRGEMEELGFYACVMDLEDELIRALGSQAVEEVIESEGQLPSFHTLQKQLPWRGQTVAAQLHRFLGSGAYRKIRYARLLVEALELKRVPRPLNQLLARL